MPLATLRPRSSFRDLRNGQSSYYDSSPDLSEPPRFSDVTNDGRPQTSRSYSKSALRISSTYDNGPILGSRPHTLNRFSFNNNRHASDPQLSTRYRQAAQASASESSTPPAAAPAPIIGITAPTWRPSLDKPKRRFNPFASKQDSFRSKTQNLPSFQTGSSVAVSSASRSPFKSLKSTTANSSLEHSPEHSGANSRAAPSIHGGEGSNSLSVPMSRVSASSLSEHGSRRPSLNVSLSANQRTNSASSSFFRLPRKKKKEPKGSLFPLPVHLSPSNPTGPEPTSQTATIKAVAPHSVHTSQSTSSPPSPQPGIHKSAPNSTSTPPLSPTVNGSGSQPVPAPQSLVAVPLARQGSTGSAPAPRTSSVTNQPLFRGRSGTTTSFSSRWEDERSPTPLRESGGRNSMASTTIGRNSVAGIRSITSRWRHPSDSNSPGVNSPKDHSSKNDSFGQSKETLVVPDREEGETAGKYYARLEGDAPKKSLALTLSKSIDPFHLDVLRSLMRTFKFYEEPMDISLRKFLWEIDLPGEAQQIDRVMSAFAERYHECNPHIFNNLDLFNKNNKRKMQRSEYQKNTGGHGIDDEILGYFYDNIQYTEFIAQNPDDDESERKSKKNKTRKKVKKIKVATSEGVEKGKLDPYDFILDDRLQLEVLRPALKGVLNLDDTFHYMGTSSSLDVRRLYAAFAQPGILQVISARSRPEAFSSPSTIENPLEAHPGIVEIKVAKVGLIWRKDVKKKKTRSPWQKWGAFLTQSQLYFFRNVAWVEDLMKQSETHQKYANTRSVVFKPPIEEFKPDESIKTMGIVALVDSTYDKHKHGFLLASYDDGKDEVVLADTEDEMNDWLAKINYCGAFSWASLAMEPASSPPNNSLLQVGPDASDNRRNSLAPEDIVEHPLTRQINAARKDGIKNRIAKIDQDLPESFRKLEENVKTARHLQILAPFPPKTRNDLLSFGARMAHRVRWSRFEIWRQKCHREMLSAHLEIEGKPEASLLGTGGSQAKSPRLSGKPNALSRLNSKASAIINSQKSYKAGSAHGRASISTKAGPTTATQEADLAQNMDKAFATPADTITKSASNSESPFKLPPLALGSGAISVNSAENDEAGNHDLNNQFRHNSTASELSQATTAETRPTPTPSLIAPDEQRSTEHRPSTAAGSDKEQSITSPMSSRSNVRRSLQRTLRDSKEMTGYARSRRHKDSVSTVIADDSMATQEKETLQRGTASSFKVHGKKASVITFGSEWQNISPEERLRARKQAMSQDSSVEASGSITDLEAEHTDPEGTTEEQESTPRPVHYALVSDSNGVIVDPRPSITVNDEAISRPTSRMAEQCTDTDESESQSRIGDDTSHDEEQAEGGEAEEEEEKATISESEVLA